VGVQHADGPIHSRHRCQVIQVPGANLSATLRPQGRRHLAEAELRVSLELAIIPLEDGHDVFAMIEAEVKETGLAIQGISQHGVEKAGKFHKDPAEQALGSRDFPFPWLEHLHIQG
jgi:hypothetical protein